MRLGRLTKGTVATPAVTAAEFGTYANLPSTREGLDVARMGAIHYLEKHTGRALDNATYTLTVVGAEGGEFLLLPEWEAIVLAGASATDSTALDSLLPIVTLEDAPADPYTLTVTAGAVSAAMKEAIMWVAATMWDGQSPAGMPPPIQTIVDDARHQWRNFRRPCQVYDWDSDKGAYRA